MFIGIKPVVLYVEAAAQLQKGSTGSLQVEISAQDVK
jgi:hypothetical protein